MGNKLKIVLVSALMLTSLNGCDKVAGVITGANLSCEKVFDESVKPHLMLSGQDSRAWGVKGVAGSNKCTAYDKFRGLSYDHNRYIECMYYVRNQGGFVVASVDEQVVNTVKGNDESVECLIRRLNYEIPFTDFHYDAKRATPITIRYIYYPYQDGKGYDFNVEAVMAN